MRLTFTVAFPDGLEVPFRTRRRVLMGDHITVWSGRGGYVHAKVTGFGWEGDRMLIHATEVVS